MSRFWSPVVGTLSPYVPGEQPKLQNLVKLNTNEHPYGPSPKVLDAIRAACDDALKLYPDPSSDRLRQAIADTVGAQPGQVFVGNGSDEVLAHVFLALLKHERPLRFPDITYSFYPVYCGLYGIQYETVPLTADFRIDVEDYLPGRAGPAGAIIFPNPNAPTGRALDAAEVERIVAGNPDASSSWMRLRGFWRRVRHPFGLPLRQPAGRADAIQVALAGGAAGRLRRWQRGAHRRAGARKEQFQLLPHRSPRVGGRGSGPGRYGVL